MDVQDFYTLFVFAPQRRPLEHKVYRVPPWSYVLRWSKFEVLRMEARELPHGSSGNGFIKSNEALQISCASKYRMIQGKGGDERSCFTCMCPKQSALPHFAALRASWLAHGQHAPDHPL